MFFFKIYMQTKDLNIVELITVLALCTQRDRQTDTQTHTITHIHMHVHTHINDGVKNSIQGNINDKSSMD